MRYKKHKDGSYYDNILDRYALISMDFFKEKIIEGDNCFVCGVERSDEIQFNDEHVFPNWLLRYLNLQNSYMTIRNTYKRLYSTLRVPCCQRCNTYLGRTIEEPIKRIIVNSTCSDIQNLVVKNQSMLWSLFRWLSLIYYKMHYYERNLELDPDKRKELGKLHEYNDWGLMHHIHAVARSSFTKARHEEDVLGSLLFIPAIYNNEDEDQFDYSGYHLYDYNGQTLPLNCLMIKIKDMCIVCVLDDCCAGIHDVHRFLKDKRLGKINAVQAKELLLHYGYSRTRIENEWRFHTKLVEDQDPIIGVNHPGFAKRREFDNKEFGFLLWSHTKDLLPSSFPKTYEEMIKNYEATYLWNDDLEFIQYSHYWGGHPLGSNGTSQDG